MRVFQTSVPVRTLECTGCAQYACASNMDSFSKFKQERNLLAPGTNQEEEGKKEEDTLDLEGASLAKILHQKK